MGLTKYNSSYFSICRIYKIFFFQYKNDTKKENYFNSNKVLNNQYTDLPFFQKESIISILFHFNSKYFSKFFNLDSLSKIFALAEVHLKNNLRKAFYLIIK